MVYVFIIISSLPHAAYHSRHCNLRPTIYYIIQQSLRTGIAMFSFWGEEEFVKGQGIQPKHQIEPWKLTHTSIYRKHEQEKRRQAN